MENERSEALRQRLKLTKVLSCTRLSPARNISLFVLMLRVKSCCDIVGVFLQDLLAKAVERTAQVEEDFQEYKRRQRNTPEAELQNEIIQLKVGASFACFRAPGASVMAWL